MLAVHFEGRCVVRESTENLGQFPFHLFFFFSDVRNNVIEDVEGRDSRVTGTRDGLHSRHHDGFEGTECLFESVERDRETSCRAVGVGDDETLFETLRFLLVGNDGEVGRVDEGNDEGYERIPSEIASV